MKREEIAAAVQASVSTVRNWFFGQRPKRIYQKELDRLLGERSVVRQKQGRQK